jgi:hypothetical protein
MHNESVQLRWNRATPSVRLGRALSVLLLPIAIAAPAPPHVASATSAPHCTAAEHRQFDFWLGDWDAYEQGSNGPSIARNHVDAILDGCAIREVYEQTGGLVGQSFSIYDATRRVWHQTWVTNRGELLMIEGTFRDGRMVLQGTRRSADGRAGLLRGTWWSESGAVRELAESSADGGKTWKVAFDIVFRKHGTS